MSNGIIPRAVEFVSEFVSEFVFEFVFENSLTIRTLHLKITETLRRTMCVTVATASHPDQRVQTD